MKRIIILFSIIFINISCTAWLDVKPYDKISEEELFSKEDGFLKHLNGIYIELNRDMLYGSSLTVEMLEIMGGAYVIGTDNSIWGNYKDLAEYINVTLYWRSRRNETWNKAYSLFLNCNLLLENLEKTSVNFTGDNYKLIKGEALALRAMLHFDMLRLFGPVMSRNPHQKSIPYYKEYTLTPNDLLTASQIADEIENDLLEARILLANDPLRTGVVADNRNLRLNYYAVSALLARTNLYFGDRESAYYYSTEVKRAADEGVFPFVDKTLVTGSPEDPDRIFSSEVIFALSHSQRNTLFKNYYDPSRIPN